MILITGGTGFIGQALIRHLNELNVPVRILVRPSSQTPNLPRGVPVEAAVSSLSDPRGLRAAMVGVDVVYHLISAEWRGPQASLMDIDITGTQAVLQAAVDAGVDRFFYLSHLGADRASAYPVMKAKAITEEFIRRSGLDYTILRTAIVYGPNDGFTTGISRLLHSPFHFMFLPNHGRTLLQPLWFEDLVTCLSWSLDDEATRNRVIEVGGPEYLSFWTIVERIKTVTRARCRLQSLSPGYLRRLTLILEAIFPRLPVSQYWLDYLAVNRTCALDSAPRSFNLIPSRFNYRLEYLETTNWRKSFWSSVRRRPEEKRKRSKAPVEAQTRDVTI
jgi:NADH dehydrogenase